MPTRSIFTPYLSRPLALIVAVLLAAAGSFLLLSRLQAAAGIEAAHLEVEKSASPLQLQMEEYITYTIRITNTGDEIAAGVWMTDALPSEVTFAGALTASLGEVGRSGNVITWRGALSPTEAVSVTFAAQVKPMTNWMGPFYITNTAVVSGAGSVIFASARARVTRISWIYFPLILRNYPPRLTLNPIPPPDANRAYTVTWQPLAVAFDSYVLQRSRSPEFTSVQRAWTTTLSSRMVGPVYCAYYYRVRADYAGGWGVGPWSNVERGAPSPPAPPAMNAIPAADGNGQYPVSWSAVAEPVEGTAAEQYVLQEAESPAFTTIRREWTTAATMQTVSNCPSGRLYYYRVRADSSSCWGQGGWSVSVQGVAAAPPAPPALDAIPAPDGNGQYLVSWSVVTAPGATVDQYVLQESTDPNFTTVRREWAASTNSLLVAGGCSGETFYYRVRADDGECWGQGAWSNVQQTWALYCDDFSNAASGWPVTRTVVITQTNSGYRTRYENGEYRVMVDQGGPDLWFTQPDGLSPYRPPTDRYCAEVWVRFAKGQSPYQAWDYYPYAGNIGLIFGADEGNTNLYLLCLSMNSRPGWPPGVYVDDLGWYIVREGAYQYPKRGCAVSGKIAGETESTPPRNPGDWHRLQVGVNGDLVSVYIDGVYKGQWGMGGLTAMTRVGVLAGPWEVTPVDARFDNFRITPNAACQ